MKFIIAGTLLVFVGGWATMLQSPLAGPLIFSIGCCLLLVGVLG